jgi:hypothetical protein
MDDFFNPDPDEPGTRAREAETTISPAARGERLRKPRAPVNPEERKQLIVRRAIAIGVGIVLFIWVYV